MAKIGKTVSNTFLDGEFSVYKTPPEMDNFNSVVFLLKTGEDIILTEFDGIKPTKGYVRFSQIVAINGRYNPRLGSNYFIWFNSEELKNIDYTV